MKKIVNWLQLLQDDMAVVVILTVLVGFYLVIIIFIHQVSMVLEKYFEFKVIRRMSMQEFYPMFRRYMYELKLCIAEIENNPISVNLRTAAGKYIAYTGDPDEYRKLFDYEKGRLDDLLESMEKLTRKLVQIHDFLDTCSVPRFRMAHLFLKKKITKMLAVLRYYSDFWYAFSQDQQLASPQVMQYEIGRIHDIWKVRMSMKEMEWYLSWLDRWFVKY